MRREFAVATAWPLIPAPAVAAPGDTPGRSPGRSVCESESGFDAHNRIGAKTQFTYDLVGNLLTITDAEGGITDYRYEARNLLDREAFPTGQAGRTGVGT